MIDKNYIGLDLFEYDSFNQTLFPIFFKLSNGNSESVAFLQNILSKLENEDESLEDKTLLSVALENGANSNLANVKGQKPMDYSNIKGFNEITELILSNIPADSIQNLPNPQMNTTISVEEKEDTNKNEKQVNKADIVTQLKDLKELLDLDIISQEEFDQKKTELMQKF